MSDIDEEKMQAAKKAFLEYYYVRTNERGHTPNNTVTHLKRVRSASGGNRRTAVCDAMDGMSVLYEQLGGEPALACPVLSNPYGYALALKAVYGYQPQIFQSPYNMQAAAKFVISYNDSGIERIVNNTKQTYIIEELATQLFCVWLFEAKGSSYLKSWPFTE